MKNGQIPDHWQLKLWIALVALLLAALARQSAIDTGGMSSFNANLIFIGIIVTFMLLYLAFHEFIENALEKQIGKTLKLLGFKEKEPAPVVEPEVIGQQTEQDTTASSEIPKEANNTDKLETPPTDTYGQATTEAPAGIVKIETPTPKKIVIDYEGRREQAKKRQEDRAYEKETNVILYVGYIMSPFVDKAVVEKIIDAVTEFIHTSGVPDFPKEAAIRLSDELTTTDMMHFGWNIAKPFKKYNLHTAHFLKQVFADTFRDVEVCTIERKLKYNGTQGKIKINESVDRFEIPEENDSVETSTKATTAKSTADKSKKSDKTAKKTKRKMSAMEAAMMDMGIDPYNPGDEIVEESDRYSYDTGW